MLAAILQSAGYKTGLYTSPHLQDFRERIRIDGAMISEQDFATFIHEHQSLIESIGPSYFEISVAMAFWYFAEQKVDYAVIEVGMGGLEDSTNVIDPELAVITNVSFDHVARLGPTLEDIARNKAGIIKPGTPVVIGETDPRLLPLFQETARGKNAPFFPVFPNWSVTSLSGSLEGQVFEVKRGQKTVFSQLETDLLGNFQSFNLGIALMAREVLQKQGISLPNKAVQEGLKQVGNLTGFRGRMTVVQRSPLLILDIAHNEAGVRFSMSQIKTIPHRSLKLVWGMAEGKEHRKILKLLPESAKYYFVKPNVPRGMDAQELVEIAAEMEKKGVVFDSVRAGLEAAIADAHPEDLIWVGGSTFVVAEVI